MSRSVRVKNVQVSQKREFYIEIIKDYDKLQNSGGDDSNAYNCYSQPGCCFDQDLFLYRQMFGSDFYKS